MCLGSRTSFTASSCYQYPNPLHSIVQCIGRVREITRLDIWDKRPKDSKGPKTRDTASTCEQEEMSNWHPKGTKKSGTKILNEQGYRYENQQDYQYEHSPRAQERQNLRFTFFPSLVSSFGNLAQDHRIQVFHETILNTQRRIPNCFSLRV